MVLILLIDVNLLSFLLNQIDNLLKHSHLFTVGKQINLQQELLQNK
tara:strand:+ start:2953 stop:3090 length:138 start_codon:yes stop_codon:yes gene_type:complete